MTSRVSLRYVPEFFYASKENSVQFSKATTAKPRLQLSSLPPRWAFGTTPILSTNPNTLLRWIWQIISTNGRMTSRKRNSKTAHPTLLSWWYYRWMWTTNWTAFHWPCWVNRFKHYFMKQAFRVYFEKKPLKNCLLKRWKTSRLTAMPRALRMFILHIGHVRWSSSHGSTQLLWNKCLQRNESNKSTQNHIKMASMHTSKQWKLHFQCVTMLTVRCNTSYDETMKSWTKVFQIMWKSFNAAATTSKSVLLTAFLHLSDSLPHQSPWWSRWKWHLGTPPSASVS